jgi:predicted PurR-regulated permease PerM
LTQTSSYREEETPAPSSPIVVQTDPVLGSPLSISALILAILATIYALYVGKEVVLPIMLAVVLKLLLQRTMEFLRARLRLPPELAAMIIIICLFAFVAFVIFAISGPASAWISKAPEVLPVLKQKLEVLRQPIDYLQGMFKELEAVAASPSLVRGRPCPPSL